MKAALIGTARVAHVHEAPSCHATYYRMEYSVAMDGADR